MKKIFLYISIFSCVFFLTCKKEKQIDSISNDQPFDDQNYGKLTVDFALLNLDPCVNRAELGVAETMNETVVKKFIETPNVYSNKRFYNFKLLPGTYYIYTSVTCTCDNAKCNSIGFNNSNNFLKGTIQTVTVEKGKEIISKPPDFNH